jgi:hypothetical protein
LAQDYRYQPIIFGAIDKARPYPQLNFKDVGGSLRVFSRTNYNLFLRPHEAKNLSWKIFLRELNDILREATNRMYGDSGCARCLRQEIPCRLYVESVQKGVDVQFTDKSAEVVCRHVKLWRFTDVEQGLSATSCPLIQALLEMTQTEAERKFLFDYIRSVLVDNQLDSFAEDGEPISKLEPIVERFAVDAEYSPWQAKQDMDNIVLVNEPALVPQVWLNYIYNSRLGPGDPERHYLQAHPSRVDFIMIWQGTRHVIEIDGPEHYASFKDGQYVADEALYTRNLRIERSLRNSGWITHRFSNLEVLQSPWFPVLPEIGVQPPLT